jgi:hypothetical protein
MRSLTHKLFACLLLCSTPILLRAQVNGQPPPSSSPALDDAHTTQLEQRLETLSSALATTRQQLDQSQQKIQQLEDELAQIRQQIVSSQPAPATSPNPVSIASATKAATTLEDIEERQDALEAQVKLHEQTKVESASKYPIRLTGLILFNTFANRGAVDNIDLPTIATRKVTGTNDGSVGASFRQTILGIEGSGPRIAGARTSADISLDFFAGLAYSNFGTSSGIVRMRTASINLDWTHDSIQAGMVGPLISPLSPSSYATVAEPGMAWAGNLWTWAPQLKATHRFMLRDERRVQLEFGLWNPPAAGYSGTSGVFRTPSPGEAAKQPAYETRLSFGTGAGEHNLQIGLGGYYSRQSYPNSRTNDSWAVTADWRIPLSSRFEISGEGYRGQSLGSLGGGVYKDVLYGTDPISGASIMRGLNAIGGWTQFKSRFGQSLEVNGAIGQDTGFAGDFHALILPATASATQLRARNRMVVGNLIFRPKTYLIVSPEYRRVWTWPIYGAANTADVFTLSLGYQF